MIGFILEEKQFSLYEKTSKIPEYASLPDCPIRTALKFFDFGNFLRFFVTL